MVVIETGWLIHEKLGVAPRIVVPPAWFTALMLGEPDIRDASVSDVGGVVAAVEVAELALSVKKACALDPMALCDGELTATVLELHRLRRQLDALETRVCGEWDLRRVWAVDGARSGAVWLARATRAPKRECGSRLWLARQRRHLRLAADAWEAGEISADHLRRLAHARNPRTWDAMARDEAILVDMARRLTYAEFDQALAYWSLHADPDGADADELEKIDRRAVSFDETIGGMYSGHILLDPVSGLAVANELRRLEQRLFDHDWAEAKTRLGREPRTVDLRRSADQRRADALVEMARRSAAAAPAAARRPLFSVVLGAAAFSRLCELSTGRVVAPAALVPWIGEADLERILFAGTPQRARILFAGTPQRAITVSRKRAFTGALRRVLEVRDRRCYHPYCDEPGDRCQGDHITPHSQHGLTSQDNGRLACGHHNRLRNKPPPPPNNDNNNNNDGDDDGDDYDS